MSDMFLNQKTCSRCPNNLKVRIMSWFNDDTICMDCSDKESEIKRKLREKGIDSAMEGCGYVPNE
jgi:hypothetical protein